MKRPPEEIVAGAVVVQTRRRVSADAESIAQRDAANTVQLLDLMLAPIHEAPPLRAPRPLHLLGPAASSLQR